MVAPPPRISATLRIAVIALAIFTPIFAVTLAMLYRQLDQAFHQQSEYIPTRLYSDVSRIAAPQPRGYVEWRLKSLGYQFTPGQPSLTFALHAIDYPPYLIPENHPVLDAHGQPITLVFQGTGDDAPLQSISIAGREIPDLYLEPELVAILTRSGALDSKDSRQIRAPLKLDDDFPPQVWQAIIAIEDQHFFDHKGFDPRGLARAIWVDIRTRSRAQGGSTLTQQLVKNLMGRRGKNVFSKINELFLSILLELKFSKAQILERYLNEVHLGQIGNLEVHGVEEGAEHFFGKKLKDLNLAEIAFMAGLIRSPFVYSPYRHYQRALDRQRLVLKKMVETGQIAQGEADAALENADPPGARADLDEQGAVLHRLRESGAHPPARGQGLGGRPAEGRLPRLHDARHAPQPRGPAGARQRDRRARKKAQGHGAR